MFTVDFTNYFLRELITRLRGHVTGSKVTKEGGTTWYRWYGWYMGYKWYRWYKGYKWYRWYKWYRGYKWYRWYRWSYVRNLQRDVEEAAFRRCFDDEAAARCDGLTALEPLHGGGGGGGHALLDDDDAAVVLQTDGRLALQLRRGFLGAVDKSTGHEITTDRTFLGRVKTDRSKYHR